MLTSYFFSTGRFAVARSSNGYRYCVARRALATECEPAQRLRKALADYRLANFSRETPNRFKKQLLQPYLSRDAGSVEVYQLNVMLKNIGQAQKRLSDAEQAVLLQAAGCSGTSIPVNKLTHMLME